MTKKLESTANLIVVDLLSEGEIAGLVDQNGDLVSGRNRPGRKGYVDSSGLLQGAYDKSSGPILDETNSSANPFRYKGIFLNDTPVITTPKGPASLGREQVNFRRFYSEIRFGHQEQEPFNLLGSQNTISKGENLIGPLASSFTRQDQLSESSNSVYHTITNINVTEVIVTVNIPQLYKVESVHEETLGDMKDSEIEFFIEYGIEGEPLRNYRGDHVPSAYSLGSSPIKIKGVAAGSPYFVDFLIRIGDLNYDSGIAGQSIQGLENPYKKNRVIKLTRATREKDPEEEATEGDDTADHNRSIRWQAVVEVVPENFNYGNSVVVASQFDARYFDRIPERSFNCKLMKIPVPSNYDPESRRYKGHWDGTFSTEKYLWENGQTGKYWTNNPAWIFYDIMTNRRYGVAKFLDPDFDPAAQVDKWNLYEISKICDEIVLTGTSPRYGWSELETFKNKLKAGSNNYIELNVIETSDDADLVKKFGNSNAAGSPNMLDYSGQEIVIKTCDNNIYKRNIVSSSYERSPQLGSSTTTDLRNSGLIPIGRSGSTTYKTLSGGGQGGGIFLNTGVNSSGALLNLGEKEQRWLITGSLSDNQNTLSKYVVAFMGAFGAGSMTNGDMTIGDFMGQQGVLSYSENQANPGFDVATRGEGSGGSEHFKRYQQVGEDANAGATAIAAWGVSESSEARMIGPRSGDPAGGGSGAGVLIFVYEFRMDEYDLDTFEGHMMIAVDNNSIITINGRNRQSINGWGAEQRYTIRSEDLNQGYNRIFIAAENYAASNQISGNYFGLRVRFVDCKAFTRSTFGSARLSYVGNGERDGQWRWYADAGSNVSRVTTGEVGPVNYRDATANGFGAPFMSPILSSGSTFPAGNYYFHPNQRIILSAGDVSAGNVTTISFRVAAKNLRAGDKLYVYTHNSSIGGWNEKEISFTSVASGTMASGTDYSFTPAELGFAAGTNYLRWKLVLGSDFDLDTQLQGTPSTTYGYLTIAPMLRFTNIQVTKGTILGWQHVSKLTIDGGILENEFEDEEVCAEAGVKFTGDYEVAEPRFACNVVIQDKQEAVQVLNELASVFRGMLYYANGMTFLTTDVKREPVTLFTNANTKEGNFSYSGSSKTSRKSVVLVRYNDVFDGYRPKIEYVEDADAINKFGYQEDEVIAFGCTSRGQARRLGEWVLLTNQLEREAINFSTGLEASFLKPGDIFKVIDKNRTIKRFGGRVKDIESDGANIAEITLDSKIQDKLSHKKITIITPKKNENVKTLNAKAAVSGGVSIEEIANSHEAQITTFEFDPTSDLSEIIEVNKDKVKLNPNAKITRMTMGEMQHGRFPEWDNSAKYLTGMKVKYKNLYWIATEANDSSIPFDGSGSWERYQAFDIHSVLLEIPVGSIWIMESEDSDISVQSYLYRTLRVSEKAIGEFEINGLEYVPNKFDVIEKGSKLEKVKPLPAYSYYGSLPNASLGIEIGSS